jgi:hypothetical protein
MKPFTAGDQGPASSASPYQPLEWEKLWAPYDPPTYRQVMQFIEPSDVVLEIGAGDFRLACQIAETVQKVIAIELQEDLVDRFCSASASFPFNLEVISGDALTWDFPQEITKGVLLMRHCTHFKDYAQKLISSGASGLITNARWHMSIEFIALQQPRINYSDLELGWFACWCGSIGFKEGPAERLVHPLDEIVHEVCNCKNCAKVIT